MGELNVRDLSDNGEYNDRDHMTPTKMAFHGKLLWKMAEPHLGRARHFWMFVSKQYVTYRAKYQYS